MSKNLSMPLSVSGVEMEILTARVLRRKHSLLPWIPLPFCASKPPPKPTPHLKKKISSQKKFLQPKLSSLLLSHTPRLS